MSEGLISFEELRVYQEACALDKAIFLETKKWRKEEKYALFDQVRRSSRSIGANIAESWAKRIYHAHFVGKLLMRLMSFGKLSIGRGERQHMNIYTTRCMPS